MNRSKKRKNRLFPMLITVMVLTAVLTPAANRKAALLPLFLGADWSLRHGVGYSGRRRVGLLGFRGLRPFAIHCKGAINR
mgnify:CR=1 FL=1